MGFPNAARRCSWGARCALGPPTESGRRTIGALPGRAYLVCVRGYRRTGHIGDAVLQEEMAMDAHRRVDGGLPHNPGVLLRLPVSGVRDTARLGRPRGAAVDVLAAAQAVGSWAEICLRQISYARAKE